MSCPDPDPRKGTEQDRLRFQAEQLERKAIELDNKEYLESTRFSVDLTALRYAVGLGVSSESYEKQIKEIIKEARSVQRAYSESLWKK